jgi:hypothetical protein
VPVDQDVALRATRAPAVAHFGDPDRPGHQPKPLAVIGGDLLHIAPSTLLQPMREFTRDKLVGVVSCPVG